MGVHFWQGGRKIEVLEDERDITIHARDAGDAAAAMESAGVEVTRLAPASPGFVRASLTKDRDVSMARLRESRVVHHVYRDAVDPQQHYEITDSFYIKFKPDTSRQQIADYIANERLELVRDIGQGVLLVRVTNDTGSNPLRAANRAQALPQVEYAEPNLIRHLQRFSIPADTLFSRQWHLHAPQDDASDLVQGAGIFAPEAWDITRGVREIVIAVADDAIDLTHPDFQGVGKIAGAWNLTPSGSDLAVDSDVSPRPGDYHGTPCAGVAVAESDGRGVVGVAPGCSLLAVRFPLNMSDAHFLLMFERVSRVADVISCSWGYGPADAPMSLALRDRLTELTSTGGRRGKGLVICIAAGNNNCPVQDLDNTLPYRFRQGGALRSYSGPIDRWIAAHPKVITVSASTSRKWRSAYSSWGSQIWVCAPSNNWDDLNQRSTIGRGIVTTDNEGVGGNSDFTPGSRFTDQFGGTSSATPTVAGVCGLILSRNPALSAAEVKAILAQTADQDLEIQSETAVNVSGAFVAGRSPWFGHGKVNAGKAVRAALPDATSAILSERNVTVVPIPDRDEAVFSEIRFDSDATIASLRVQVDIEHTYVADLRVELVGPEGTSIMLHNHERGSQRNLQQTYSEADVPALSAFRGKPLRGTWRLRIVDTWAMDEGKLLSWRLIASSADVPQRAERPKPSRPAPGREVSAQPMALSMSGKR